jgi:hypothetical protein
MMHNADTHSVLYKVAFAATEAQLEEYRTGKMVVPLGATEQDKLDVAYGSLLEAQFVADPTAENALEWLTAIWPLAERYDPAAENWDVRPTPGFIPTGRILVTQGRALPEFYEYWTSVGYSAFILYKPGPLAGGWDCNEFTGDVLREAGLNGMGFPASNFGGPVDVLEDDFYGWDETIETIQL